ncbi:hypothetical protein HGA88_01595 [Candidatus Roizmanbacteria bacterium]|nr:hypothetical protein [Candidatus Roizmanbacteria bacterium]
MPYRDEPFFTYKIYHVFNKTIDKREIFTEQLLGKQFLDQLCYYRSDRATLSYSKYRKLPEHLYKSKEAEIQVKLSYRATLLAFCLMPNHFHLLLRQEKDGGIQEMLSNTVNAFTRYFNLLHERKGPIFLPRWKAVRVRTEEQLLHVSRYIHLNPTSSGLVSTFDSLLTYPFTSLREYIDSSAEARCYTKEILSLFSGSRSLYGEFVKGNIVYQRRLAKIKKQTR